MEIVQLSGRLDVRSTPDVLDLLENLIEENALSIVIDMEDVDFISSYGVGVLVSTSKSLEEKNGKLKLACLSKSIMEPFEATGLIAYFEFFDTCNDAVNSFSS